MRSETWKWVLGLVYLFAVATIWIAASFVVQSVVEEGVSPFLITYICNSLFVVYIPLVEIGRYLEDKHGSLLFWVNNHRKDIALQEAAEQAILLRDGGNANELNVDVVSQQENVILDDTGVDAKGRWTRRRVAKVSLLICPIWFLAQLSFNFSLKYTTVTVRI